MKSRKSVRAETFRGTVEKKKKNETASFFCGQDMQGSFCQGSRKWSRTFCSPAGGERANTYRKYCGLVCPWATFRFGGILKRPILFLPTRLESMALLFLLVLVYVYVYRRVAHTRVCMYVYMA
ncbi:unnamed protein product [Ixodes persulcatus]